MAVVTVNVMYTSSSSADKYGTGRTATKYHHHHSGSSSYVLTTTELSPDRRSRAYNSVPRQVQPASSGGARSSATPVRLTDINGNIRSLSLSKSLSPSSYVSSSGYGGGSAALQQQQQSGKTTGNASSALLLGNDKRYDATKKRLDAFYSSRTPSSLLNKSYNYTRSGNLSYFEKYNKQQQQQQDTSASNNGGDSLLSAATLTSRYANMNKGTGKSYGGGSTTDNGTAGHEYGGGRSSSSAADSKKGVVGIRNIGNTCYMNSVLQCLSNTKSLTEYVLDEADGADGKLIRVYRDLLSRIWSGNDGHPVDTTAFKSAFQRLSPRFVGYDQQDAQEFLRLLLDKLHMDINRVKVKPRSVPELDETLKDNALAADFWQRYLATDNSAVVDLFAGQLKSTLECSVCGHKSITFEVTRRPYTNTFIPYTYYITHYYNIITTILYYIAIRSVTIIIIIIIDPNSRGERLKILRGTRIPLANSPRARRRQYMVT